MSCQDPGLQVQELRDHQAGGVARDLLAEEDNAVVEQARVDVVATLATRVCSTTYGMSVGCSLGCMMPFRITVCSVHRAPNGLRHPGVASALQGLHHWFW